MNFYYKNTCFRPIKNIKLLAASALLVCVGEINAQTQQIKLPEKQITIEEVFRQINKQTQLSVGYNYSNISQSINKKVHVDSGNVQTVLEKALQGTGLTYRFEGNHIIITVKEKSSSNTQNEKKGQIKGRIVDNKGEAIIGASIIEKGTTNGTITDFDGNFTLNVTDNALMEVSFIGYKSQLFYADSSKPMSITMKEDTEILDEIVVVGYGVQKKSDLTGAVGSVQADAIEKQSVTRIDQALQGRISGVQITSAGGAPGNGASIRIRGNNSINGNNEPLFVIDGIIGAGDLNSINPSDIQSIEVLKDASSIAIYGSRGANGVILITTKSGKGGEGFHINYNGYYGIQKAGKMVDFLDGPEYKEWINESENYFGRPKIFSDEETLPNIDWQKEMYHTASMTEHNVSLSNNTSKGNFFFSLNYLNQDGIMKKTNFTRYQARFNFNQTINEYLKMGAIMNVAYTDKDNPRMSTFGMAQLPVMSIYNEDGSFNGINPVTGKFINTVTAEKTYKTTFGTSFSSYGNAFIEYSPFKGLTVKSSIGVNIRRSKDNIYNSVNLPTSKSVDYGGYAAITQNNPITLQNENTISYSTEINKHRINLLGGWTSQTSKNESLHASAHGFTNDVTLYHAIQSGAPETKQISSGESKWSLLSALFRANYVFNNRYYFTISGRADGSSRLSSNNRWAFFPSAAIAWRVSEEKFMKNINFISNLKLRFSYGRSGSQSIAPYSTLDKLGSTETVITDNKVIGYIKQNIANKNLTWEKTDQFDLGLNYSMLNNRINVEFDYYHKKTKDLLLYRELAYQTGYNSILENVGSIENHGIELALNTQNIITKNFSWNSVLTLSSNKSKVLDLAGKEFLENGMGSRLIVGQPVGTFFGIKYLGTWKEGEIPEGSKYKPGDPKLEDVNKDGQINIYDGQIIGNSEPKIYGGFGNTFTYKNFSLDLFFDYSVGNDIYDLFAKDGYAGFNTNLYGQNRDRWSPKNPNSNIPSAGSTMKYIMDSYAGKKGCSLYVQDGSYLRLKNINFEYKIPCKKLNNISIYTSISNLFTITKYDGYTPDVNAEGGHSTRRGFDNNVYPQPRTFIFGLKLGI